LVRQAFDPGAPASPGGERGDAEGVGAGEDALIQLVASLTEQCAPLPSPARPPQLQPTRWRCSASDLKSPPPPAPDRLAESRAEAAHLRTGAGGRGGRGRGGRIWTAQDQHFGIEHSTLAAGASARRIRAGASARRTRPPHQDADADAAAAAAAPRARGQGLEELSWQVGTGSPEGVSGPPRDGSWSVDRAARQAVAPLSVIAPVAHGAAVSTGPPRNTRGAHEARPRRWPRPGPQRKPRRSRSERRRDPPLLVGWTCKPAVRIEAERNLPRDQRCPRDRQLTA